jgi:hypothetical protein
VAAIEVEERVGAMIMQAKKVLLSGPPSLAPQVVGLSIPEAEALLKSWLNEALTQLHHDPLGRNVS